MLRTSLGFDLDSDEVAAVPIFMVERNYADQLEPSLDAADGINRINAEEGVRWMYSFLSADKRKTYCLYEAPSPEAIRTAAARAACAGSSIVRHKAMTPRYIRKSTSTEVKRASQTQ